jgi:hypothetical protein
VFGLEKVDQKTYNSSIKPMESMRILGFSNHEKEAPSKKFLSDQRSAARFRDVGGAL